MPLILAIEPDKRQAAQLKAIAHGRLGAELVIADTADAALEALGDRVPDLILTPVLISQRDEAVLNDRLRALERAAQYVQTVSIPQFAAAPARKRARGMLAALRRQKPKVESADGCDPEVFAEQCLSYLERAAAERESHAAAIAEKDEFVRPEPLHSSAEPDAPFVLRNFYDSTQAAVEPSAHVEPPAHQVFTLPGTLDSPTPAVEWVAAAGPELDAPAPPVAPAGEISAAETAEHAAPVLAAPGAPAPAAEPQEPAIAIRSAPAIPEWLGVRQLWPAIDGLQADQFLAAEPSSMNSDAGYDRALHLEVLAPERKAASGSKVHAPEPPAAVEPVDVTESQSSRDDDLQIFDLDLDALASADGFEEDPAAIEAKPSLQETDDGDESGESDAGDIDGPEEADLQVYDLDLSTLLGEPEEASAVVAAQTEDATGEVALEPESDTVNLLAAAPAPAKALESDEEDEDVEFYDLDLDLLADSFDDPPDAAAAVSTHGQTEAKPVPAVKVTPATRERPAVQPIAQNDDTAAPVKPKTRAEEPKRAVMTPIVGAADESDDVPEPEPTRREIEEDERVVTRSGIWAPLRLGVHQLWPRLEGGLAQPPRLAVVGPADAPVVAILPTSSNESKQPEWLKAIKSLRRDNSRSQAERERPSPPPQVSADHELAADDTQATVPVEQPAETPDDSATAAVQTRAPQQGRSGAAAAPAKAQTAPRDGELSKSKKRRMARKAKKNAVKDEWGFFDPEQVGFGSLVNKLDEIADKRDDGFPSDS